MKKMFTLCRLVLIVFAWCLVGGCGAGSTTPTGAPTTIPTAIEYGSIEYAGGAVDGSLSVQMGKTLSFIVKDTDGIEVSDPDLTVEFLDSAGDVVTDGSCGGVETSGSDVIYTAPLNWKGVTSQCSMNVYQASTDASVSPDGSKVLKADGDTPFCEVTMIVSLSPVQAVSTEFSFSSNITVSNAYLPAIAVDHNIKSHICYTDFTSQKVYYSSSTDLGTTWSAAQDIGIGSSSAITTCAVAVSSDGATVAVAGRSLSSTTGDRGATTFTITEKVAYNSDGGGTFSVVQVASISGSASARKKPIIAMDPNDVVHVAISDALMFSNIYLAACDGTSCTNYASAEIPVGTVSAADMAIAGDGKISVVYVDSSNIAEIVQATFDGSAHSIGSAQTFASPAAYVGVNVNMDGLPILTWNDSASIYEAPWDGGASDQTKVADVTSTLLNIAPYVSYDNAIHIFFNLYDQIAGTGTMYHTMQDGSGGFTAPNEEELTGFNYSNSAWGVASDLVGRPYIIWNSYDATEGLKVYLAVGQIVTSE